MASLLLTAAVAGCPGTSGLDAGDDTAGLDTPGRDTPGLDGAGLDVSGLDVPGRDAPGLDVPGLDAPGDRADTPGCAPSCAGRECGSDGCGGDCGACPTGATCAADGTCDCPSTTCGTDVCGVSSCGRECGRCGARQGCFMGGCIPTGMCPGMPCTDRRGNTVCEGTSGLGTCTTDPGLDAVCVCTGGGGALACDACIPDAPAPVTGSACASAMDCPAGVPCTVGICGVPCDPTTTCARGDCFIPGDVAGVCLDGCGCDTPGDCEPGTRCVDLPDGTGSVCIADSLATGRLCTLGG